MMMGCGCWGKRLLTISCIQRLANKPRHDQDPSEADDESNGIDGRQEHLEASKMSNCHTPPMLALSEHARETISLLVPALVLIDQSSALLRARDTGAFPFFFQFPSELVAVIPAFRELPFDMRLAKERRSAPDLVAHLSGIDRPV